MNHGLFWVSIQTRGGQVACFMIEKLHYALDYEKHKNSCSAFFSRLLFLCSPLLNDFFPSSLWFTPETARETIFLRPGLNFWLLFSVRFYMFRCRHSGHVARWFSLISQPPGLLAPVQRRMILDCRSQGRGQGVPSASWSTRGCAACIVTAHESQSLWG